MPLPSAWREAQADNNCDVQRQISTALRYRDSTVSDTPQSNGAVVPAWGSPEVPATSVRRFIATAPSPPPSAASGAGGGRDSGERGNVPPPYQPSPIRAARSAERRTAPPTQIGRRALLTGR